MTKGLLVFVLRSTFGDCTNGGVTAKYDKFVLTGPGVPEIFEPSALSPELRLIVRQLWGKPYYHAEPVLGTPDEKTHCGPMAGGNYVTISDSRLPFDHPISVHDRFETWELYNRMSM